MSADLVLHESWKRLLASETSKPYFVALREFLMEEKRRAHRIFPPGPQIFAALDQTPPDQVKVVLLGQDPYHGEGQAHGMCFSVNRGMRFPPSLRNIFKELETDCGCKIPSSGDLRAWAAQGVLLLNATLTVRANEAGSHQNRGWEQFTDRIISMVSGHREHVVFILWGKFAQSKEALIDQQKHLVLKAAHPSPLSAHNGFFGCRHFSKANEWLIKMGIEPINWQLV
jgi:uracil-DNA glycosylase